MTLSKRGFKNDLFYVIFEKCHSWGTPKENLGQKQVGQVSLGLKSFNNKIKLTDK